MAKRHIKAVQQPVTSTHSAIESAKAGKGVATKDKVSAKAMSDMQAMGKVIADKIVSHMEGGERGMYAEMMQLSKSDLQVKVSALGALTQRLDDCIKTVETEYTGDYKVRKINSVRASFSRIITVVKAMVSNVHTYDFGGCESMADMVAVARTFSAPKGAGTAPLNATGFDTWIKKASRIVDVKGYDKASDTSTAQVARLERFIVQAVKVYCEVSGKIPGLRFDAKTLSEIVAPTIVRDTAKSKRTGTHG